MPGIAHNFKTPNRLDLGREHSGGGKDVNSSTSCLPACWVSVKCLEAGQPGMVPLNGRGCFDKIKLLERVKVSPILIHYTAALKLSVCELQKIVCYYY